MKNLLIVIPAIKKNATIPDQLIKKLNGTTLIQRAINTAKKITKNILIITDSEEISLICERNQLNFYYDKTLIFSNESELKIIGRITKHLKAKDILVYQAITPLVNHQILIKAYQTFLLEKKEILISVKKENKKLFHIQQEKLLSNNFNKDYYKEVKSFLLFSPSLLEKQQHIYKPFILNNEDSIEINNYQDWWVCEKILQRKKIIFNVIGSVEIGMGHIYHSLALAHEITDHEIIFVCDDKYRIAVDKIASTDYNVIPTNNVLQTILNINPDLVVNDILNTNEDYILTLKEKNIKVINFEDLGKGSRYADIVFNELYDFPQIKGDNYYWGYQYLTLRDEFYEAKPHQLTNQVEEVIITFGGSDQNNLTLISLKAIIGICKKYNITINIVCGSGYLFKKNLENFIKNCEYKDINLTYAVGVISKIMEKTQLAISSNGRTVYELADMNIPSIVVSHHKREDTHTFANLKKGFINLGVINTDTEKLIEKNFLKLVTDRDYRELLFMNIRKFNFRENKTLVVKKILSLL